MKTISARKEDVQRNWFIVDANGETLGRLATAVAHRLRGKHKAIYTPHTDTGDYVVVVNAAKVGVTGNKLKDKMYHHHTGYPGGLKSIALGKMLDEQPERAIENAVKGMLPRTPLGREMMRKLKIYPAGEHPHSAQQPISWQPGAPQPAESLQQPALKVVTKTVKKPAATKKTAAPKKEAAAKDAAAKKAAPKKAASAIVLPSGKKIKQDDLTVVEGIGPKIAELLTNAGIADWAALAKSEPADIAAILAEAGSRYAAHKPDTWPRQAQLCVDENWEELEAYQDALDGGKE